MSNIASVDSENIETIALPSSQTSADRPITDTNVAPVKLKHMCKTNLGFVAINGTQSCEVPDKDMDSKQVSKDIFSPNVCYSTSLFCSTVSLKRKLLNVL